MPSQSEAQRRAMEAAAHGHSTIGIPQKVGREFAAADKALSARHARSHKTKPATFSR